MKEGLTQEESCRGCKAAKFSEGLPTLNIICIFGYRVITVPDTPRGAAIVKGVPQEPCPKPITWDDYCMVALERKQ